MKASRRRFAAGWASHRCIQQRCDENAREERELPASITFYGAQQAAHDAADTQDSPINQDEKCRGQAQQDTADQ